MPTDHHRRPNDRMTINEQAAPAEQPLPDEAELRHRLHDVAHDVRSMLGPIVGFADLITTSSDIEQCRAHAERIGKAALRLEQLADDLVDRVLEKPA